MGRCEVVRHTDYGVTIDPDGLQTLGRPRHHGLSRFLEHFLPVREQPPGLLNSLVAEEKTFLDLDPDVSDDALDADSDLFDMHGNGQNGAGLASWTRPSWPVSPSGRPPVP